MQSARLRLAFGYARLTCWLSRYDRQLQIAFALLNGKADGCSRGKKQGNEAKDSVVGRRAFAAANGKSCGVRAAGGHFGGRRECVAADDLRGGERVVQAERAASSSRVKIWLKSKPLIRFGVRKV